ncbi:MAG TPA: DUF6356 family protein [Patescibacteria group bacterium]|nr:DUF6356 family protein [Patescibacteria group bacterium]
MKLFTAHCHATGETYFQHLAFTLKTAAVLVGSGAALDIHGIAPFLFETTASTNIRRLHTVIISRAQASRPSAASAPQKKAA